MPTFAGAPGSRADWEARWPSLIGGSPRRMLTSAFTTIAHLPIAVDRERIARFCRERGVRSLALFGSVLRDDFDPERSDVDVLAEFAPGALRGVGLRYFDFAEELGAILGHKVDFCSQIPPVLRDRVSGEAMKLYEEP